MIDLSRIANNALAVGILAGFGYAMYQGMRGNQVLDKLKDKLGRFKGNGRNTNRR